MSGEPERRAPAGARSRVVRVDSVPDALHEAARALGAGGVVGIPTDTVYGLAASLARPGAPARLFGVKGRPERVALPVLAADAAAAAELALLGPDAERLAERFWPGPLTLVLRRRPGVAVELGGDPTTIGLRVPALDATRSLLHETGPLATTSANRHGEPPATTAAAVAALSEAVALVLDAGVLTGSPSSVVDLTGDAPRLLRAGSLAWEEIAGVLGGAGSPPPAG